MRISSSKLRQLTMAMSRTNPPRARVLSCSCNWIIPRGFSTTRREQSHNTGGEVSRNRNQETVVSPGFSSDFPSNFSSSNDIDIPNKVATLLAKHVKSPATKYVPHKLSILDAGAGGGLTGVAIRQLPGFDQTQAIILGAAESKEMMEIANSQNCYNATLRLNLHVTPFCNNQLSKAFLNGSSAQTSLNIFDAIVCVGAAMAHLDPTAGTLREFCRWVKPGGYICYTLPKDRVDDFRPLEEELEQEGVWSLVESIDEHQTVIHLYEKIQ